MKTALLKSQKLQYAAIIAHAAKIVVRILTRKLENKI
jgi:hypothetical protein